MNYMGRAARMQRHHKRNKGSTAINLVSMIDMLTVLVFFLLVYSTERIEVLSSSKDVQLPKSIAETQVHHAVVPMRFLRNLHYIRKHFVFHCGLRCCYSSATRSQLFQKKQRMISH